jgi:polysaccharide biosynthesis protein PslH
LSRPRILFVAPVVPFPVNSGTKIRVGHLLRALCGIGDVDAVCYAYPPDWAFFSTTSTGWPDWWKELRSLQLVPHPEWPASDPRIYRKRISHRLFGRDGLMYASYPAASIRRRMTYLAGTADLVWIERLYTALAMTDIASKTIVDLDDLESIKMRRLAETQSVPYNRWSMRREAERLGRTERNAARRFAKLAVCAENDLALFGEAVNRIWVLPNGVEDRLLELPAAPVPSDKLIFVGTLNYEPNLDAIRFFCDHIFPIVRARRPTVSLSIVGLKPVRWVLDLHNGETIFVHSSVLDVAPFIQAAAVSIVPLRVGGGTRLKILESLALGTPVVSTTVGAEGLDLYDGEHLLLADSPLAFAESILRILAQDTLRVQLVEAGRRRVREQYLWSSIRSHAAKLARTWLAEHRDHVA